MPGELERLIQAILQPKRSTTQTVPAQMIMQQDVATAFTDLGAALTLSPSNNWDSANWGECPWS